MHGRLSGFFMTIIMALPLAAIPLMAIFGIPQFGSLASTMDADTGFLQENPTGGPDWDSAPAFSDHQSVVQSDSQPSPAPVIVPVSDSVHFDHAQHQSSGNVSWEQAIEQLARYGIHDYRLQPGLEANSFHFACYLHGNDNGNKSSTVIRFEAEAANPLQAVQNTLQQIEKWYR